MENATAWFTEHVRANPSITEVAREVHVSPSTLRRLFRRTLHEQPTRVFGRIQVEKGMRLMTETKLKLDSIAEECGFSCTSDFCRAFKAFTKVSPNRLAADDPRPAPGRDGGGAARLPTSNPMRILRLACPLFLAVSSLFAAAVDPPKFDGARAETYQQVVTSRYSCSIFQP